MKKIVLSLILGILPVIIFTQNTFSKIFRGGHRAGVLANALMEKDTIYAYGEALDSTWAAWFMKLDTSGNILMQRQYEMQPFPEFFVSDNNDGFIKTTDGGFAMLGITYFTKNEVFIKIKNNGDVEFIKYYPTIKYSSIGSIIETNDGYLLGTTRQDSDFKLKGIIVKTDKKGNIIKETLTSLADEAFGFFHQKNKDTIIMTGRVTINGKQVPAIRYLNAVDGSLLSTQSLTTDYGTQLLQMQKSNFGWVSIANILYEQPSLEPPLKSILLNGMDEKFNLIWQKPIAYKGKYSWGNTIAKLSNDEYAAFVDYNGASEKPKVSSYNGAFIQKFNGKGDLLWHRLDTVFWAGSQCINNYLNAFALPSGNIIVMGWTQKCYGTEAEGFGAYAWIVKLSKNGCLLEPLCGMSATGETFDVQQFRVFPNPANSLFNIEWKVPNSFQWTIALYNYNGQIIQKQDIDIGQTRYTFDVDNLANGIYFYDIRLENGTRIQTGKVIIQK